MVAVLNNPNVVDASRVEALPTKTNKSCPKRGSVHKMLPVSKTAWTYPGKLPERVVEFEPAKADARI